MMQASQRIFTNITADAVVKKIARSHGFASDTEPHPRVWDNLAQSGTTDLEFLTRLAKHTGYNLRVMDTTVSFKPHNFDFDTQRTKAPSFYMRDPNDPRGSTLYTFDLVVGNAINYGGHMKSAIRVSGVDSMSGTTVSAVQNFRDITLRVNNSTEVFDRFATEIVAPAFDEVNYEAMAAEARNRYPYRALVQVSGNPEVKPSEPVYLDGLGPQYTGYWIPLSVEHVVQEESLNVMRYVTIMEVGADSLGAVSVWTDGVAQAFPNSYKKVTKNPTKVKKATKKGAMLKT